jgi:hypothetical protein
MTGRIGDLDYYELAFAADGNPDPGNPADGASLAAAVADGGIRDIFVLSHGWNSDVQSARSLYQWMFGNLSDQLGQQAEGCAAVGIIWPSLLFPEDQATAAPAAPSTGAALAAHLAPAFPRNEQDLGAIGDLLDRQPEDPQELERFHHLALGLVSSPVPPPESEDSNLQAALAATTAPLLTHAAALAAPSQSSAQDIGNPFGMLWKGAREVLRAFSYYEMKNRAGVIGSQGLGPYLGSRAGPGGQPRIYLMGHSFGARLVANALAGLPASAAGPASPVKLLYLIQGAFSHFSFASPLPTDPARSGLLASCAGRVDGPFIATFSKADRAVGTWYPTASFLQRQDNEDVHDFMYRWEGMGHDGYQQAGATTVPMRRPGESYGFSAGGFYCLDANAVISQDQNPFAGAHSAILHPEVLWPVVDSFTAAAGR